MIIDYRALPSSGPMDTSGFGWEVTIRTIP